MADTPAINPPANDDDLAVAEEEAFEKVEKALGDLRAQMTEMVGVAVFHHKAGRLNEAEQLYRAIIDSQPQNADALQMLGMLMLQKGDARAGMGLLEQAAALAPENPDILCNLGTALRAAGRTAEAGAVFQRALYALPGNSIALHGLGAARVSQGDLAGARTALEAAVDAAPERIEPQIDLGKTLLHLGEAEAALARFDNIISKNPDSGAAHLNRSDALIGLGRAEEAHEALETALEKEPGNPQALTRMGAVLRSRGDHDAALRHFDTAVEKHPDFAEARWQRAAALLAAGDFARGWPEYEWRWRRGGAPAPKPAYPAALWEGGEIEGLRLFIYAEPGADNAIQFIRYAKVLADRGAEIVLGCQPSLASLFGRVPGVTAVAASGGQVSDVSSWQALSSLPGILGTTLETIPADVPYISADPARVETWAGRLADLPGPKIGVVWRGGAGGSSADIPAEALAPLGRVEGVSLIGMQAGCTPEEAAAVPGLTDMSGELHDLEDTAALTANLDMVIAADSHIAHLAGAMAKPVRTLLPTGAGWCWMLKREDSPWYPAMRLYRQETAGAWDGPAARAAADLSALAG
ncbi:MAG: tetratricopeptide repeat protein [Rhodospirillales bacterium]